MHRQGHIIMKLRNGLSPRAPSHLDVLAGAARPVPQVDGGGRVDRTLQRRVDAVRVRRSFHAAKSFGRVGEQAAGFDPLEESLGLSRTVGIELSDPDRTGELVRDLRDLEAVEWAMAEPLALAPLQETASRRIPDVRMIRLPHDRVGAARALAMEPGDPRIFVAVIDTGVSLGHQEFPGRLYSGFDTVDLGMGMISGGVRLVGDSLGWDFCASDGTGHGSHVAGVIGARGLHLPPGLAGQCPLIPIRSLAAAQVAGGKVVGIGGLLNIDAGIKVAVDMGARVLNMSFGTPADALDESAPAPHSDVIQYAVSKKAIPVAAIGNSGRAEAYYPAALPQTIAVGSMNAAGERSHFSTYGEHIDLCAHGEEVVSAGLKGYSVSTGTSHSTPFVSGAAALLLSRALRSGRDLEVEEIRRILCESASPGRDPRRNNETGAGLLNVPAALAYLDNRLAGKEE